MSPVPCEGARAANYKQDGESAEHVERAPQAMQRRLWAHDSIPVALERDKGLVDRGKGNKSEGVIQKGYSRGSPADDRGRVTFYRQGRAGPGVSMELL